MANPEHLEILKPDSSCDLVVASRGNRDAPVPHSGTKELSPSLSRLGRRRYEPESRRDGRENLPKHKPRVVGNSRLLQHRQELLLETPLRVMLRLAVDVIHHRLALRLAHTEGAIAFLPRKTRRFIQPSRGISFELLHRLGQRDGRRQRDEEGGDDWPSRQRPARECVSGVRFLRRIPIVSQDRE